ncbi:MAG: lysophospholipase [Treponema sp.]|nr:lysophospholipase [Treponema sp.]
MHKKSIKILILIICILLIVSCRSVDNTTVDNNIHFGNFFETQLLPAKGVVLTVHGLNLLPSKMGDDITDGTIAKLFLDEGYHVYHVTLPGHVGPVSEMRNVKAQDWLDSALEQYREAAEIARENNIPVYLAAFSLGALVYLNLMLNEEDVAFAGAVLFAPAIAVKGTIRFAFRAGSIFLLNRSIIPGKSHREYRAHSGASVSANKALFELEDALYKSGFTNCNIPALIFISPRDELISISKIKKHIEKFNLTNWNIVPVSISGAENRPRFHHLIIDNKSVSPETWEKIHEEMFEFLP